MNDEEQKKTEAQLRQFFPARLPEQLMARILAGQSCVQPRLTRPLRHSAGLRGWFTMLRWLAPVTAVGAVVLLFWRIKGPGAPASQEKTPAVASLRADGVQLGQKLVSSFDAVAQLPSGEPVRFRVQKWEDHLVWEDKRRGLTVEESSPRLVVVPIRFETY